MIPPRYRILLSVVPLIVLGCIFIAAVNPRGHLAVGFLLGPIFGQTSIASAWTAIGTGPALFRLSASLGWMTAILGSFVLNAVNHGYGVGSAHIALCFFGQWVVLQIPFWGLAVLYGWRLRHRDAVDATSNVRQFGINQLLVFTGIVAALLGAGRAILAILPDAIGQGHETGIFIFLAIAAALSTLPLIVAGLMPKHSAIAVFGVLLLIAIGTWLELPLLNWGQSRPGPKIADFIWINLFTCIWVLAFVLAARLSGYGVAHRSAGTVVTGVPPA